MSNCSMRVGGRERLVLSTIVVLFSLLFVFNMLYGASSACPATGQSFSGQSFSGQSFSGQSSSGQSSSGQSFSGQSSSGDFRAFYTAAVIAASSDAQRLYDLGFQAQKQEELDPSCRDQFLAFVYPAPVAVLLIPLSFLSYHSAYIVHCTTMMLALLASCYTFTRWKLSTTATPNSDNAHCSSVGTTALYLAVSFSFLPLFFSIIHGQNSALLLFALGLLYYVLFGGLPEGRSFEHGGCGISNARALSACFCLLLLCFKPQILLPFLVFLAVYRQWRILLQFSGCAVGGYILAAFYFGYGWIGKWLLAVQTLSATEYRANASQMLGIESLLFVLSENLHALMLPVYPIVYLIAVTLLLLYTKRAHRYTPQLIFVMLVPLMLIAAPHIMYYEASLLVLCYVYCDKYSRTGHNLSGRSIILSFLFFGVGLMTLRNTAVLQLFAITAIILFLILLRRIDMKRNLVAPRT